MQKKNAKILIFSAFVSRNLYFWIIYLNFPKMFWIFTFSLRLTFYKFWKKGFNESKLHVIYNSLEYTKQYGLRKKLKETTVFKDYFKNEMKVLIFVGRLTKVKKLNMLIKVLKLNNYNLVIVGNGEEKKKLTTLVHQEKLTSRVWFYGESYDEIELSNLIYNADVCVSPGNVGLTAIHSLSYGTPVITHNNFANQMPEFEAIVKDYTGDFFKEDSIEDMAFKIKKWLSNKKGKRKEIRVNCFKVIDTKFNPHYQINVFKKNIKWESVILYLR